MVSGDEFRVTTAVGLGGGESFVSVSAKNAAYTRFLMNLKATGKLAGEVEYFVALDGEGNRVGRVAATLGPSPRVGLVGLLALRDTHRDKAWVRGVVKALLSSGERWLLTRGVDKVYGPVDFSTFFEYRLRDGTGEAGQGQHFAWEPAQPQSYLLAFEAAGYAPVERYHSVFFHTGDAFPVPSVVKSVEPAWRAAIDRGMEFAAFDEIQPLERLTRLIEAISLDAFKDNFLYAPIAGDVFQALYQPIVRQLDLSLSHVVYTPDGQDVGFVYAFEDSGYCIVKTIAVRPAWRGLNLSNALLWRCLVRADEKGMTRFASALVRDGNVSEYLENRHCRHPIRIWKHHYVLLGKTLKGVGKEDP